MRMVMIINIEYNDNDNKYRVYKYRVYKCDSGASE